MVFLTCHLFCIFFRFLPCCCAVKFLQKTKPGLSRSNNKMIIATLVLKVKYFQQILVLLNLPNYYHLSGFAFVQNKVACSVMRCSKSYIGLGCDTRSGNPFRNPQLAWPVPIIPLDYVKDVAWSCHIWFIFAKIHFFSPQIAYFTLSKSLNITF